MLLLVATYLGNICKVIGSIISYGAEGEGRGGGKNMHGLIEVQAHAIRYPLMAVMCDGGGREWGDVILYSDRIHLTA